MALIKCHECNHVVSTEAQVCQNCGAKVKKPIINSTLWIGRAFIVFIGALIVRAMFSDPAPFSTKQTSDTSTLMIDAPIVKSSDNKLHVFDAKVTEEEFNKNFRCPESFNDEAEREQAFLDVAKWYFVHNKPQKDKDLNAKNFLTFRMNILKSHNCDATLTNIKENNSNNSDKQDIPVKITEPSQEKVELDNENNLIAPNEIEVRAKIGSYGPTSVPGTIVCEDYDTVHLMIQMYKNSAEENLRASILGEDKERLIHGAPTPAPNVEDFGCILVSPGTHMIWDGNWMPAVVYVTLPNRKKIRGVTDSTMISN